MRRRDKVIKLDREITIQSFTEVQNSFGEKEITFSDLATVRAAIEYGNRGTTEDFEAKRETATTSIFFTVRYNSTYKSKKNRIVFEAQNYDIIAVIETGARRQYLRIEAQLKE